MKTQKPILCIDWGTSSFRGALVDPESQKIQLKFQSDLGCKIVFQQSQKQHVKLFDLFIETLQNLLKEAEINTADFGEIIISGMASSNIGMKELPYAKLPFSLNGKDVVSKTLQVDKLGKVTLISGIADQEDIMRGEETQLLGLQNQFSFKNASLIFPGTHSKHMTVGGGVLTGFKTYLTGELFQLMSEQSILSRSVMKAPWSSDVKAAFNRGIEDALNENLLNSFFRIRARDILGKETDQHQNYFYLSGLLIGNELITLKNEMSPKVFACDMKMKPLYKQAVHQMGITDSIFIEPQQLANSYIVGQLSIANH